jgi:hypothetical protein
MMHRSKPALAAALCFLVVSTAASGRPAGPPDTPQGRRMAALLEAFDFAGGTSGVNAVIEADLDTGYTIVVLSNLDPPSAERVAKKLRGLLGLS